MRETQHFSITLPQDMAELVESKVRSGSYASVSDVMRDGLAALLEGDAAIERWLRDEVVKSYDDFKANPAEAVPADQVMDRVRAPAQTR